ncbi:MAG: hypothetical protein WCT77_12065, partial [Bacteroidota bacterium]
MKYFILFFLLSFTTGLFAQETSSQIISIPRIGTEINQNDRMYFSLFPNINGFISCKTIVGKTGGYDFVIQYDSLNKTYTKVLSISQNDFRQLSLAIENYEYIFAENEKKESINWKNIINIFINPKFRYDADINKNLTLVLKNGTEVSGRLLKADSSFLVIDINDSSFNWRNSESHINVFHYSEIMEIKKPFSLALNGYKSIYNLNLSHFQKISSFQTFFGQDTLPPPPEIIKLLLNK